MVGKLFNIQKFSVNDGPGIRTTVFLKGCPLRCIWCHNPESLSRETQVFFLKEKCSLCRSCAFICKKGAHKIGEEHLFDRAVCTSCGECIRGCLGGALEAVGYEKEVDEVLKEVLKDEIFYQTSGGGLTVSGGEPLYQFEFTLALLKGAKEKGLHTCIETSGFAKEEKLLALGEYTDIFLYDFKESNPLKHKEYTGVDNAVIISNLKALDKKGNKIILRCPIIPGLNDREDHFEKIAEVANSLENILEINLEPYHPLGQSKAQRLGKEYALESLTFPPKETIALWEEAVRAKTNVPVKQA